MNGLIRSFQLILLSSVLIFSQLTFAEMKQERKDDHKSHESHAHVGHDMHGDHNNHAETDSHELHSSHKENEGVVKEDVHENHTGHSNHDAHANHKEESILTTSESTTWIEEKTGTYLPLDVEFLDSKASRVTLGEVINKPTIILPIYYFCPGVCSVNLSNLATSLNHLNFSPGTDYRVVALSFNDVETPEDAKRAKRNYLKLLKNDFPEQEWLFLTGSLENIKSVTDALGYGFKKLPDGMFIHATVLAVVDREGQIIRYVYGKFLSGDIDIGISDAIASKPASSVKRLLSYCFNYRPNSDNFVFEIVKVSILFIFVVTLIVVFISIRRSKKKTIDDHSTQNSTSQEE